MRIIIILLLTLFVFSTIAIAEQTGDVHLYCKPKVRVYLDGELAGKTNKSDSGIFLNDLSLGKHSARLMKKGKSNEILIFSVNRAKLEIESHKFNIGKFTEEVRNSKLVPENRMVAMPRNQYENSHLNNSVDVFMEVKPEISDLYIPGIDEEYEVDSLPKMSIMAITPHQIIDQNLIVGTDKVWVKGLIDPKGSVDTAVIIKSCGNESFDSLAYRVALDTKFKPAIKDNRDTWVWGTWAIPYTEPAEEEKSKKSTFTTQKEPVGNEIPHIDEKLPPPNEFVSVEQFPEMIMEISPVYPKEAKRKNIEGVVWVKALVNKKGDVIKSQIAKSSGNNSLDDAALKVAPKYKYKPAISNGKPIAIWVTYKVVFKL